MNDVLLYRDGGCSVVGCGCGCLDAEILILRLVLLACCAVGGLSALSFSSPRGCARAELHTIIA